LIFYHFILFFAKLKRQSKKIKYQADGFAIGIGPYAFFRCHPSPMAQPAPTATCLASLTIRPEKRLRGWSWLWAAHLGALRRL
jgi:hypothetical protein